MLQSANLERLADTLADQDYVIIDDFLSSGEVDELVALVEHHLKQDNLNYAGVGRGEEHEIDRSVRGDLIKWLDPEAAKSAARQLLGRIHRLMKDLNRLLFLSMVDFESHLAVYPPGAFYERHLDQFRDRNFRKLSFVIYLNKNWDPCNGGELVLFTPNHEVSVVPTAGRMVLFRSDTLEHEVRITGEYRLSITGWMLDRPLDWPIIQ